MHTFGDPLTLDGMWDTIGTEGLLETGGGGWPLDDFGNGALEIGGTGGAEWTLEWWAGGGTTLAGGGRALEGGGG